MAIPVAVSSIDVLWAYGAFEGVIPVFGEGEAPRHLVLTGPNGTGKSTILRGLADALASWPQSRATQYRQAEVQIRATTDQWKAATSEEDRRLFLARMQSYEQSIDAMRKHPIVDAALKGDVAVESLVALYLPANRRFAPAPVLGPSRLNIQAPRGNLDLSKHFLQYLVNRRSEQAFAREDDDNQAADAINQWFHDLQDWLRKLLQNETLVISFDRKRFLFELEIDERIVQFDTTLPDGFASILRIWSEILVGCSAVSGEPTGFVLIDEPELHLHPELQETLLPLLTHQFPTLQFIIATHSPIVMQSLANATIYDLERKEASRSEDWQGVRYGNVLKAHFGSPDEFDAATKVNLERLHTLDQQPNPTPEQLDEMRDLARPLAIRGHLYAIRVLTERGDD